MRRKRLFSEVWKVWNLTQLFDLLSSQIWRRDKTLNLTQGWYPGWSLSGSPILFWIVLCRSWMGLCLTVGVRQETYLCVTSNFFHTGDRQAWSGLIICVGICFGLLDDIGLPTPKEWTIHVRWILVHFRVTLNIVELHIVQETVILYFPSTFDRFLCTLVWLAVGSW